MVQVAPLQSRNVSSGQQRFYNDLLFFPGRHASSSCSCLLWPTTLCICDLLFCLIHIFRLYQLVHWLKLVIILDTFITRVHPFSGRFLAFHQSTLPLPLLLPFVARNVYSGQTTLCNDILFLAHIILLQQPFWPTTLCID
jgi:hypothetical protein